MIFQAIIMLCRQHLLIMQIIETTHAEIKNYHPALASTFYALGPATI
jgi:hypothetical protein